VEIEPPDSAEVAESDEDEAEDVEDWYEFPEPVGDESYMKARTVPKKPVAGESANVEVVVGSGYGRPKPKVWVRLGDPSESFDYQNPDAGPEWRELMLAGGRIWDLQNEKWAPLGQAEEYPMEEQPGESYYEVELTFPAGKSSLEFRMVSELLGGAPVAFRGWDVEVD
jgi:hypothetical protein